MKKICSLLLVIAMLSSLCACGGENDSSSGKTEVLTADNVSEYLDVNAEVVSCTTNEGYNSILKWATNEGTAKILIETQNDSGAKFKKVTVTCEVTITGSGNYGWEFVDGNIPSEDRGTSEVGRNDNSKIIKIDLPYDGEESVYEEVELALYTDEEYAMVTELSNVSVRLIDAYGTVEIE